MQEEFESSVRRHWPTLANLVERLEQRAIVRSLIRNKNNRTRAARELGIPKSTLYNKIRRYSISVRQGDDGELVISATKKARWVNGSHPTSNGNGDLRERSHHH